ncbi:unnamed protein product [Acanthoscelides obtectus]|uniref:Uncharacterized protein n=1 Tax=Acanthoscelides obtectus TaxID=200917 RepID=A0A9P0K3Q8_ACAOB|nr:unnamed protein product [Acanthoscelides obtectus]CAK1670002.1 hypothetical protein AOBTE_LOCUS27346 [Acanthoscelides obtectus]
MPSTAQWTYIKHNVNGDNTLVTVKLEIQKKTYSLFIGLLENHKVRLQLKDTSRGAKKRHEIKDVLYPDIPKSISKDHVTRLWENNFSDMHLGVLNIVIGPETQCIPRHSQPKLV